MFALLGLVALTVAAALLLRYLRRRAQLLASPGASIARAVAVADFGEIDTFVQNQRCSCRGAYEILGEGPVAGGQPVRFTRVECRECGSERSLYFDISATVAAIPPIPD